MPRCRNNTWLGWRGGLINVSRMWRTWWWHRIIHFFFFLLNGICWKWRNIISHEQSHERRSTLSHIWVWALTQCVLVRTYNVIQRKDAAQDFALLMTSIFLFRAKIASISCRNVENDLLNLYLMCGLFFCAETPQSWICKSTQFPTNL